ncbi:MAG: hypothetical protein JXL97_05610 [Bacteroidales bacterium]|nr:hypothetical protein [Bacteroidales bacterium]
MLIIRNVYFSSEKPIESGLPFVSYCADELFLSSNYLFDLLKKETGKSAQEYIQLKLIDVAKEKTFKRVKQLQKLLFK